jgi:hypothetical protein
VAGAGEGARVLRENLLEEAREGSSPVRGAMLLGELAERLDEARLALAAIVEARYRIVHETTFRQRYSL